jgi:hypothetical protein
VQEIISKVAGDKKVEKSKFSAIRDALAHKTDEQLTGEFQAYLDASTIFFQQIGVCPRLKNDILSSFKAFVGVRREWLQDDKWVERNSSKYYLTEMPDIWHDSHATDKFITSFCEDVCSVLNTPGNKPKIYRKIREKLQLTDTPTSEVIKSKLGSARPGFWN